MKRTNVFAVLLVFFGSAVAFPFEDGFEAKASTCWADVKSVDASNDKEAATLVQPGSLVCLDASVAKFNCVLDNGACKRESPPVPPTGCKIADPLIKPAGFTEMRLAWEKFMNGAPFPHGNSYLSTNGSFTFRSLSPSTNGVPIAGRYITIPFVAPASGTPKLVWLGVQRQNEVPLYTKVRPARVVFVSVSPCAGDLRPPNTFAPDPFLSKCRALTSAGNLAFGPQAACKLVAGQTYYINVAWVNPTLPLSPTLTTCSNPSDRNYCETNFNAQ